MHSGNKKILHTYIGNYPGNPSVGKTNKGGALFWASEECSYSSKTQKILTAISALSLGCTCESTKTQQDQLKNFHTLIPRKIIHHIKILKNVILQLQLGFFTEIKSHKKTKLMNNEEDNSNHIT
jgi:hypothetical protein